MRNGTSAGDLLIEMYSQWPPPSEREIKLRLLRKALERLYDGEQPTRLPRAIEEQLEALEKQPGVVRH